tara:strand:+ start:182 stop:406 length:225 start_codon:yes stop_codon:yes gene_type:complete
LVLFREEETWISEESVEEVPSVSIQQVPETEHENVDQSRRRFMARALFQSSDYIYGVEKNFADDVFGGYLCYYV